MAVLCAIAASADVAAQDLSTTGILQPVSGCALTAGENVTVRLFNFGPSLPAGSSFNVSYQINAGGPVTELVTLAGNLLTNSQFVYTFTTQANLSTPGSYTLDAAVTIPGDINPTNNAFSGFVVVNSANSAGGTLPAAATGSSGNLVLSGQTGSVVHWEESTDSGARWYELANTTSNQAYANLRVPTQFRALVQNANCAPALSGISNVTP